MRHPTLAAVSTVALLALTACEHVEMEISAPAGGVLEDAILITSSGGEPPREVEVLGDIDLSQGSYSFRHDLDEETSTHWWLLGHIGDDIVFTSRSNLSGSSLFSVPPYAGISRTTWHIPSNINAFASGTSFSRDWWAQTLDNHAAHLARDGRRATLWRFSGNTFNIGSVAMTLHVPN